MRYLTITYYRKASGQTDEVLAVTRNIKTRDIQQASVILDFAKMQVVKATVDGQSVPRDFDKIVGYYHQHYASTIDRLLADNGLEAHQDQPVTPAESA
jgi:hypothetical protein